MSKYCPECGKELSDIAKFCGGCGTKIELQPFAPVPAAPSVAADKQPKNIKKWLIPLIASVAALAIVLGVVLMPKGEQTSAPTYTDPNYTQWQDPSSDKPASQLTRTVMVYIVGSNLESEDGAATLDITEMVESNFDTSKINLLLCAGGSSSWDNTIISPTKTAYYKVAGDDVSEVHTSATKNMGAAATLSEFLNYTVEQYPADRYSLILWDHGGGPLYGYGNDELSGDHLTMQEMVSAFESSPFASEHRLELLGFDACLMGTVETAWSFRNYAQYFVASQELEPGYGWDYDFLSDLPYCNNGAEIGRAIVDKYFAFYDQVFAANPSYKTELTLSCLDLSKVSAVEQQINQVFSNVNQDILAGHFATASRCRYNSKSFGKYGSSNQYDLVDLQHISSLLAPSYAEAANLQAALRELVVYSRANVAQANGVSIYHPYENMSDAQMLVNQFRTLQFASKYAEYIANFVNAMKQGGTAVGGYSNFSSVRGTVTAKGDQYDLSLQLTAEQLKTFSSAEYHVFWEMPASTTFSKQVEYLEVFSGQDVSVSADGKLTASYGGKAVFGKDRKTGKYSDCPLAMTQIYDGTREEKYYFPCLFWYFGENLDMDVQPVNWLMKIENGAPTLSSAYKMHEQASEFPDKWLVDSSKYEIFGFMNNSYITQKDADGNVSLKATGSTYGFEYTAENGFDLELRPITDKSQYRAVFVIEDIYGNRYVSDFIPLQ